MDIALWIVLGLYVVMAAAFLAFMVVAMWKITRPLRF
jgi:hypothetical protein